MLLNSTAHLICAWGAAIAVTPTSICKEEGVSVTALGLLRVWCALLTPEITFQM